MIRSVWLKKVGYKILSLVFKNGMTVSINDIEIKLPVYYFRLFPKDYEKDNFKFVKSSIKSGDVVIDIGAHIGLMAAVFGKLVKENGKVFSFEPTPGSYSILCETVRINKLNKIVTPVNMPVTEKSGLVNFCISDNVIDVANTLTPWEEGKSLKVLSIRSTSIDDFVESEKLNKLDFIKIDAEGAELQVLKGGYKTIKHFKPKINLALHPAAIIANKDSLTAIYFFIKDAGYKIYFEDKELGQPEFCEQKGLFDVHLLVN